MEFESMLSKSILIIEDELTDALLTRRIFRKYMDEEHIGVHASGVDGLQYLLQLVEDKNLNLDHLPKLILLDLKMPGISGFEFLQKLRNVESTKRIPVVVLTSSDDKGDIKKAIDSGANSYLVKPNTLAEAEKQVQNIVHYWLNSNRCVAA